MDRNEYALNKIKEIYRDKKMTINDFADLIGKSRSAWLRRESGEVPLTVNENWFGFWNSYPFCGYYSK